MKAQKEAAEARAAQAEKDRDTARLAAHDAKKEFEGAQARATQAEKDRDEAKTQAVKDAAEEFQAAVDARVELLTEAQPLGLKDEKDQLLDLKKMDERAIKVAAIKAIDGEDIDSEESVDFVNGMYRSAMKRAKVATDSRKTVRQNIQANRDSGAVKPARQRARQEETAAKDAMNKQSATRWAQKTR